MPPGHRQLSSGFFKALALARLLPVASGYWMPRHWDLEHADAVDAIRSPERDTRGFQAAALEPMPQKIQMTPAGAAVLAFVGEIKEVAWDSSFSASPNSLRHRFRCTRLQN